MAINNTTWTAGTAAQRLISVTKLNQVSADAVNKVDDIHPQYTPSWYSKNIFSLVTGGAIEALYELDAATSLVNINRLPTHNPNPNMIIGSVRFKCLPSVQLTNAYFRFKGQVAGTSATRSIYYVLLKNGVDLGSVDSPTATSPSWDSYSHDISLATPVAGDIIEASIRLYVQTPGGSSTLLCKDIEIYFS